MTSWGAAQSAALQYRTPGNRPHDQAWQAGETANTDTNETEHNDGQR